jgi:hypothetical protein
LGGFGTVIIVLAWSAFFPKLRKMDRLLPEAEPLNIAQEAVGESRAAAD